MMPIYPIAMDPATTPNPTLFDGFRHYRARALPGQFNRHQFATTSATNLHFGHGKFSCPGRFFAGNSVKMVLANLLLRYEFGFLDVEEEEGKEEQEQKANETETENENEKGKEEKKEKKENKRPRNVCLHEYVFPDPDVKVRFRVRVRGMEGEAKNAT